MGADLVRVVLPEDIGASFPWEYVRFIGDPEIASIEESSRRLDNELDITNTRDVFVWKHGGHALHISRRWLYRGVLSHSTFGDRSFISFTLVFGPGSETSEGPVMLTSLCKAESWFRRFAAEVAPHIPGGVLDRLG